MQRPHTAEIEPWLEVQVGKRKLQGYDQADGHSGEAPENRCDGGEFHRAEIVVRLAIDFERRRIGGALEIAIEDGENRSKTRRRRKRGMKGEGPLRRLCGDDKAKNRCHREEKHKAKLAAVQGFFAGDYRHADSLREYFARLTIARKKEKRLDPGQAAANQGVRLWTKRQRCRALMRRAPGRRPVGGD